MPLALKAGPRAWYPKLVSSSRPRPRSAEAATSSPGPARHGGVVLRRTAQAQSGGVSVRMEAAGAGEDYTGDEVEERERDGMPWFNLKGGRCLCASEARADVRCVDCVGGEAGEGGRGKEGT